MVRIEIRGERALVTAQPGSGIAPFEESAARLRCKFVERGDAIGYFDADTSVMGGSTKPEDESIRPATVEVFEIKDRVYPSVPW